VEVNGIAPRTDPSERNYRTGLLPRVVYRSRNSFRFVMLVVSTASVPGDQFKAFECTEDGASRPRSSAPCARHPAGGVLHGALGGRVECGAGMESVPGG
jgi:hypothetical protein